MQAVHSVPSVLCTRACTFSSNTPASDSNTHYWSHYVIPRDANEISDSAVKIDNSKCSSSIFLYYYHDYLQLFKEEKVF